MLNTKPLPTDKPTGTALPCAEFSGSRPVEAGAHRAWSGRSPIRVRSPLVRVFSWRLLIRVVHVNGDAVPKSGLTDAGIHQPCHTFEPCTGPLFRAVGHPLRLPIRDPSDRRSGVVVFAVRCSGVFERELGAFITRESPRPRTVGTENSASRTADTPHSFDEGTGFPGIHYFGKRSYAGLAGTERSRRLRERQRVHD